MDLAMAILSLLLLMTVFVHGSDTNSVFDPCSVTKVRKDDGFTFGIAFSAKHSFFANEIQLSPCDRRLLLADGNTQLAVFRPKVDEISLLTINSTFDPVMAGGHMVAFAGRKYAARSTPVFVADHANITTSFILVLDFKKGTLQNLYWINSGCSSCKGKSICLNNQDCALPVSQCKRNGGPLECDLGIQIAFSGTDQSGSVLNSWYEVANLRKYSLFALFSNIRDTITHLY